MAERAVQLVLNADEYRAPREGPAGGGPPTDFYAGRDAQFARHRQGLLDQLKTVRKALAIQPQGEIGVVKVDLAKNAWAKSHRPLRSLFKADRTPVVGGGRLGQMLIEVSPIGIDAVLREVLAAETETRWVERDGKRVANPTRTRSEVGAISSVEVYGRADRRRFSAVEAASWLSDRRTGGAYRIELFEQPTPPGTWSSLGPARRRLYDSFAEGLNQFGDGARFRTPALRSRSHPAFGLRLVASGAQRRLPLGGDATGELAPFDPNPRRHEQLLAFLDSHPLVRRITLPSRPVVSDGQSRRPAPTNAALPSRGEGPYPRVGVIDSGLGRSLADWTVARYGFLGPQHRDEEHGTFIGGLLVGGQAMNGADIVREADGCDLVDVDVYPMGGERAFEEYFGDDGVLGFFAEVGSAVATCRRDHATRIFNLSVNMEVPVSLDSYSDEARMLDEIAEENDAIVVVSAGNLAEAAVRPEWAKDPQSALAQLATARDDGVASPSESIRNVGVAALNAPGLAHCVGLAPAKYSRRGPGLRAGVKPDFGQVGGTGTIACELGSGLFSVDEDGTVYADCGTSFAAPLVAKTLAGLDVRIEGPVSRETLLALTVHNAEVPEPLRHKLFAGVARQMAGFGCPTSVEEILRTNDDEITLIFPSRLMPGRQLTFPFSWPRSLTRDGSCRGQAKLTVVATPPLDYRFGAEFVRINLEGALQQYDPEQNHGAGGWHGQLKPAYLQDGGEKVFESALIEHGLKWSPTKVYSGYFPRGVGRSSDWRLSINYLTRSGETMPDAGVPFTAVLTIRDPKGTAPVFDDLRQTLQSIGVRTSDIRTAARVAPRV